MGRDFDSGAPGASNTGKATSSEADTGVYEKPATAKFTERLGSLADAYEMYKSEGTSLSVSFENDRLNEIRQGESYGISIRAVKQGKIGFSYSSKPDEIDHVAQSALRMAPWGKPYDYEFAAKADSGHTRPYDPACGEISVERSVELCENVKDIIKSIDPEATADVSIRGGLNATRIATSRGQDCREDESGFGYFVSARISEEGNFLTVYRGRGSARVIADEEILEQARETGEEFKIARKLLPFSRGKYRVLFAPHAVADLLLPIAVGVNGMNIARKTSRFVDSLGEELFDKRISLEDDPFHPDAPSGALYDGEGVPAQKRPIIENGVLKGFVHTLSTAQKCGHAPTGNGQRSVSSQPSPGLHSVIMAAGDTELDQMYRDAEGGLCVSQLLGTFTSNFLAGQVSGNVSLGFLVRDGRRAGRVKNCALNVNSFDVLKSQVVSVSKQREWVGGEYLPWLLIDGIGISAR
ncbi:MAG: TldD/PmbA family protein [Planctomycetes bacterium]|nr:TldD/PmbA family protein [Planctomycetota bacterium]